MRKAELAVDKGQDDLARAALERYQSFTKLADGYTQQVDDQQQQVDTLRNALEQLDQKLSEARAKSDLLIAQHRRARALAKASDAQLAIAGTRPRRRLRSHAAEGRREAKPSARPSPSWWPTMWTGGSTHWRRTTRSGDCSRRSRPGGLSPD